MDDYISRQAAIDAIKTWGLIDGLSEGQAIEILADKEKLPAADVVSVVHSTWIENGDPLMLTCGNCGYGVMRYNNTRFCPNCCAKMDGERKGEHEQT